MSSTTTYGDQRASSIHHGLNLAAYHSAWRRGGAGDFAGGSGRQRQPAGDARRWVRVEEVRPEVHHKHPENQELLPVPGQAVRREEEGGVAPARPQPPRRLRRRAPARLPAVVHRRPGRRRRRRGRRQPVRAQRPVLRRAPHAVTVDDAEPTTCQSETAVHASLARSDLITGSSK